MSMMVHPGSHIYFKQSGYIRERASYLASFSSRDRLLVYEGRLCSGRPLTAAIMFIGCTRPILVSGPKNGHSRKMITDISIYYKGSGK